MHASIILFCIAAIGFLSGILLLIFSEHKETGFAIFMLGILFTMFGVLARMLEERDRYLAQCYDQGYVEAYQKGNSWYCLSFGDEPRILKLSEANAQ